MPQNYTIAPDGKSITCHRCGLTSYNPNDVTELYCGNCDKFHDDDDFHLLPTEEPPDAQ